MLHTPYILSSSIAFESFKFDPISNSNNKFRNVKFDCGIPPIFFFDINLAGFWVAWYSTKLRIVTLEFGVLKMGTYIF